MFFSLSIFPFMPARFFIKRFHQIFKYPNDANAILERCRQCNCSVLYQSSISTMWFRQISHLSTRQIAAFRIELWVYISVLTVNITKLGQHWDTGSSLDPAVSIIVLNLSKLQKHKLMSFEKCTSGQQSSNLFVILYLVRSDMPLVSNHMPFQKVEPSTGHNIPFNNIYIIAFVAFHMATWPLSGSPVSLGLEMYTKNCFLNGFSFLLF